jgi:hypothetical protein
MNESLDKDNENIEIVMDEVENVNNEENNNANEEREPSELSADTPSESSDDNIYTSFDPKENNSIKSEYSAETPVEENIHSSYPFIILGDPFCDNYICNPICHKYCIIKWRMRNLHTQIDSLQKEMNYLRKDVNDNENLMRKNKTDAENLVVYSKEILKSMQSELEKKYSWNK